MHSTRCKSLCDWDSNQSGLEPAGTLVFNTERSNSELKCILKHGLDSNTLTVAEIPGPEFSVQWLDGDATAMSLKPEGQEIIIKKVFSF